MRRFLLTAATAATALVGTACSDVTGIGGDVAGSYELIRVNGQSLPADDNSGSVTIHGGLLELHSDGTFVDILQFRVPGDPLIRDDDQRGTWDRTGSEILLDYNNGAQSLAERTSSSRLVVEDEAGNRLEYRRF